MKQRFILYSISSPFNGYIKSGGIVDPDEPRDGSSPMEYLERQLAIKPDLRVYLYSFYSSMIITEDTNQRKKFDSTSNTLVDLGVGDITPTMAIAANLAAKNQAIVDNLPTWAEVSTAVDNITSLADAKVFLKKLSRVVYWLAKSQAD